MKKEISYHATKMKSIIIEIIFAILIATVGYAVGVNHAERVHLMNDNLSTIITSIPPSFGYEFILPSVKHNDPNKLVWVEEKNTPKELVRIKANCNEHPERAKVGFKNTNDNSDVPDIIIDCN
jgi:hypothetical protein